MADSAYRNFTNNLNSRLDAIAVVGAYVSLKQGNKSYRGLCPFHTDTNESFHVYFDDKSYHCFGCQAHGNLIDFVAKMRNLEYTEAANQLAESVGLERFRSGSRSVSKDLEDMYSILGRVNGIYRAELSKHAEVTKYLEKRGIDAETSKKFSIGYAPPEWQFLSNRLKQYPEDLIKKTGLLAESQQGLPYDFFRDRVVFPIREYQGRVLGFGGRTFREESTDPRKYINSTESPIFKKREILYGDFELNQIGYRHERLLLVEGYMDVVGLAQHGINYALGILGTAVNQNHLQQAFAHTQEVVICFDGDEAGRKAAERALEAALPEMTSGRILRFLFLPEGSDPDSQVQEVGKEKFEQSIQSAQTIIEYIQSLILKGQSVDDLNTRIAFVDQMRRYLSKIPHQVTRLILIDELVTSFPEPEIQQQLKRFLSDFSGTDERHAFSPSLNDPEAFFTPPEQVQLDNRTLSLEKKIVARILRAPDQCAKLDSDLMKLWCDLFGPTLLYTLWSWVKEYELDSAQAILASCQGQQYADQLHEIYADFRHEIEKPRKYEPLAGKLSNGGDDSDLKTAIETTISQVRARMKLRDEFQNSDVYQNNRKT